MQRREQFQSIGYGKQREADFGSWLEETLATLHLKYFRVLAPQDAPNPEELRGFSPFFGKPETITTRQGAKCSKIFIHLQRAGSEYSKNRQGGYWLVYDLPESELPNLESIFSWDKQDCYIQYYSAPQAMYNKYVAQSTEQTGNNH